MRRNANCSPVEECNCPGTHHLPEFEPPLKTQWRKVKSMWLRIKISSCANTLRRYLKTHSGNKRRITEESEIWHLKPACQETPLKQQTWPHTLDVHHSHILSKISKDDSIQLHGILAIQTAWNGKNWIFLDIHWSSLIALIIRPCATDWKHARGKFS